jgi:hypothetical protein
MPSTFSLEGRIDTALRELGCGGRPFVDIARDLGVRIAHGPFSEAMTDKKAFDNETGERLLDVLGRMALLQSSVGVPIRWSETQQVSDALALRLLSQIGTEQRVSDSRIDQATDAAMQKLSERHVTLQK